MTRLTFEELKARAAMLHRRVFWFAARGDDNRAARALGSLERVRRVVLRESMANFVEEPWGALALDSELLLRVENLLADAIDQFCAGERQAAHALFERGGRIASAALSAAREEFDRCA